MVRTNMLSPQAAPKPTILVEPESGGSDGRTRVKVEFSYRGGVRSDERLFETLAEALAYAQSLCERDS
jgi:hypothetical protein